MRAIILVAGKGSRLPKKYSKLPKSFLKLNNKKLIDILIENFKSVGIKKISLVTGYKSNVFKKINHSFTEFHNIKWRNTNMVYSLMRAKKWLLKYPCIVTYGDILYEKKVLVQLIKKKNDLVVSYDKNWKKLWLKRFADPLKDAETFKVNSKSYIKEIGNKTKNINNIKGQYMGLILFRPKGWEKFSKCLREEFKNKVQKIYLTDVLQKLIKKNIKIKAVKYTGHWAEVDNSKDYKIMKEIYKKFFK